MSQEEIAAGELWKMEDGAREADIEAAVDSIQQTLAGLPDDADVPFTIFTLPSSVRREGMNHYEPTVFSIGPYHRGKLELKAMEEHKKRFLRDLLSRAKGKSLRDFVVAIRELVPRARSCYAENESSRRLNNREFVEMLLMDACFILELFCKVRSRSSDSALWGGWTSRSMQLDLIRLENQIPFFVLQRLLSLLPKEDPTVLRFKHSELRDVAHYLMDCPPCPRSAPEVHHLLHLCYLCLTPRPQEERQSYTRSSNRIRRYTLAPADSLILFLRTLADILMAVIFSPHRLLRYIFRKASTCFRRQPPSFSATVPCAAMLQEYGVRFTEKKDADNVCDISFSRYKGIMQIPELSIDREALAQLANLIAYEQYKGQRKYLVSFAILMQELINSPKDVAVLRESKIIVTDLDDKELVDFFHQICKNCVMGYGEYCFIDLTREVGEYCEFKLLRWRAYFTMLKRDYFSNPWALISFLAAVILLGLTITQTFFAIYPYYHPRS